MENRPSESRPPRGPRGLRDPREWYRDYPERKIAGVCASLARNLEISVTAVRAVFIGLALFHGAGLILYGVLWALLPDWEGEPSALDRLIRVGKRALGEGVHAAREASDLEAGAER